MDTLKRYVAITLLLLLCILPHAAAASTTEYTTTYTITLQPDSSALWTWTYRTPLATGAILQISRTTRPISVLSTSRSSRT